MTSPLSPSSTPVITEVDKMLDLDLVTGSRAKSTCTIQTLPEDEESSQSLILPGSPTFPGSPELPLSPVSTTSAATSTQAAIGTMTIGTEGTAVIVTDETKNKSKEISSFTRGKEAVVAFFSKILGLFSKACNGVKSFFAARTVEQLKMADADKVAFSKMSLKGLIELHEEINEKAAAKKRGALIAEVKTDLITEDDITKRACIRALEYSSFFEKIKILDTKVRDAALAQNTLDHADKAVQFVLRLENAILAAATPPYSAEKYDEIDAAKGGLAVSIAVLREALVNDIVLSGHDAANVQLDNVILQVRTKKNQPKTHISLGTCDQANNVRTKVKDLILVGDNDQIQGIGKGVIDKIDDMIVQNVKDRFEKNVVMLGLSEALAQLKKHIANAEIEELKEIMKPIIVTKIVASFEGNIGKLGLNAAITQLKKDIDTSEVGYGAVQSALSAIYQDQKKSDQLAGQVVHQLSGFINELGVTRSLNIEEGDLEVLVGRLINLTILSNGNKNQFIKSVKAQIEAIKADELAKLKAAHVKLLSDELNSLRGERLKTQDRLSVRFVEMLGAFRAQEAMSKRVALSGLSNDELVASEMLRSKIEKLSVIEGNRQKAIEEIAQMAPEIIAEARISGRLINAELEKVKAKIAELEASLAKEGSPVVEDTKSIAKDMEIKKLVDIMAPYLDQERKVKASLPENNPSDNSVNVAQAKPAFGLFGMLKAFVKGAASVQNTVQPSIPSMKELDEEQNTVQPSISSMEELDEEEVLDLR